MRRRLMPALSVVLVMSFVVGIPAALAQPAELEELEPTVLTPPGDGGGKAEISVIVQPGDFAFYWLELQRATTRYGGTVTAATAEIGERDGRTFSFGVAELEVPPSSFAALLGEILGFGRLVEGSLAGGRGVGEISVSLSESDAITEIGEAPGESTIARALNTAGNVVLTIASVVIIVAAAVVPIGLLVLAGYAVWRWTRRRLQPIAALATAREDAPELVES